MTTIIDREQFKSLIKGKFGPGKESMIDDDSVLWIPEEDLVSVKCQWFVIVPCINASRNSRYKADFWLWCSENLAGNVRCFYSDDRGDEEAWGFTIKEDIPWWLLRWEGNK